MGLEEVIVKQRIRMRAKEGFICDPSKKHWDVIKGGVDPKVCDALQPQVEDKFAAVDVNYYGKPWQCSSYTEKFEAFQISMNALEMNEQLLEVIRPMLDKCDEHFNTWFAELHPELDPSLFRRVHSFVTRYLPEEGQTHLRKHVDGKNVDGSAVIQLPSTSEGGGLKVWDPEEEDLMLDSGDIFLLDHGVWHQSNPITSGVRWVIVIFYACTKPKEYASKFTSEEKKENDDANALFGGKKDADDSAGNASSDTKDQAASGTETNTQVDEPTAGGIFDMGE